MSGRDQRARSGYIAAYPVALFATWVAAWILNTGLRSRIGWEAEADTLYWMAMKVTVWILPAVAAIRLLERTPVTEFIGLRNPGHGLRWGVGVGAVVVFVSLLTKGPSSLTMKAPPLTLAQVNAAIVAPLVEEITLRGSLLRRLALNGHPFWRANAITTVVFVAMHLPGWYVQGVATTLISVALSALPLAGLSLLFGWVKQRSGSLYASIVLHAVNNAYSAFTRPR